MPNTTTRAKRQPAISSPERGESAKSAGDSLNRHDTALIEDMLARIDQHLDAGARSIERAQRSAA